MNSENSSQCNDAELNPFVKDPTNTTCFSGLAETRQTTTIVAPQPTNTSTIPSATPNYYQWDLIFPELEIFLQNISVIRSELRNIGQWVPWPEDHFQLGSSREWTVFPFLYTFPAYDSSSSKWVPSTCAQCPRTVELLRSIPNVRTALFSRLGPGTKLSTHTGWADLANYVLRCHICLEIPDGMDCGLLVNGETKLHTPGSIIVFDDSKKHRAFNNSLSEERIVLIIDILRPEHLPLGTAVGGHTDELDNFMSYFK